MEAAMWDEKALRWEDKEILMPWQLSAAITLLTPLRGCAFKQVSQVFISLQLSFQLWPDMKLCHISTEMKCPLRKRSCWENTGSQADQTAGGKGLSPAKHCGSAVSSRRFHPSSSNPRVKWRRSWCSALKSGFQIRLLGDSLYLGGRADHCWATPSQERPPDRFSKSCHQIAKTHASNGTSWERGLQKIWKALSFYSHMEENWPFEAFQLKTCSDWEILLWHLFQRRRMPASATMKSPLPWFSLIKWLSSIFQTEGPAMASVKTQIWTKIFFVESLSRAALSSQSILARESELYSNPSPN